MMRLLRRSAPPLCFALLVSACGGDSGPTESEPGMVTVSGEVTAYADGTPVEGATVRLPTSRAQTTTGSDGRYALQVTLDAEMRADTLIVEKSAYERFRLPLTLRRSAPDVPYDVRLIMTLRSAAASRGLLFGTPIHGGLIQSDPEYRPIVNQEFSLLASGWELFWRQAQPERGRYDFSLADDLFDVAGQNGVPVHGHTLVVWNPAHNPDWINGGDFTRDELLGILEDHISTVVGRYADRVPSWDVVNEGIAWDNSGLMPSVFLDVIGPEYVDSAFVWARRADPDGLLCYNESSADAPGTRADLVYDLVTGLLDRGVPVDCVGFQMHLVLGQAPAPADILANLRRFADLGLAIRISEMDVRIELPASPADLEEQARVYRETLAAVLQEPAVESITVWGFTDKESWIPGVFEGYGAAHLWDESYRKKPAYRGVVEALSGSATP